MELERDRIETVSWRDIFRGPRRPSPQNPMNVPLPGTEPFAARAPPAAKRMTAARIASLASRGNFDLLENDGSIAHAMHPVRFAGGHDTVGLRPLDVDHMGTRVGSLFSAQYTKYATGC